MAHQARDGSLKLTLLGLLNVLLHYPIYQVVKTRLQCSSQRLNICFYCFEGRIFQGRFSTKNALLN